MQTCTVVGPYPPLTCLRFSVGSGRQQTRPYLVLSSASRFRPSSQREWTASRAASSAERERTWICGSASGPTLSSPCLTGLEMPSENSTNRLSRVRKEKFRIFRSISPLRSCRIIQLCLWIMAAGFIRGPKSGILIGTYDEYAGDGKKSEAGDREALRGTRAGWMMSNFFSRPPGSHVFYS